jgi:hypothetical protein
MCKNVVSRLFSVIRFGLINVWKSCSQNVYTARDKYMENYPHEHCVYTQRRVPGWLFHNFIHRSAGVLRLSVTMFYTRHAVGFYSVKRQFSALSIGPTTATTNLINT